ncbi:MAG: tRNA epoxyqueuosine(34) reductase QueG [Burkholderiaceae bacterium]|nr:tRNA epoxyqueuosine(34) reductase QueG [Burkholderiaceae bacterium]
MNARGAAGGVRGGPEPALVGVAAVSDGGTDRTVVSSAQIAEWARELGFGSAGVAGIDLAQAEPGLQEWLAAGCHGEMDYMARHGLRRARPAELVPGTLSVVMATMDYAPDDAGWRAQAWQTLATSERAYVSRYALGRDYHKVVRARLEKLAQRLAAVTGPLGYRVFCDSAPVLEVALAERAGLGWRGKHTLLLNRTQGSSFFLGTLYTDLPLPPDPPLGNHCGSCERCLSACPTGAIVAPYRLDARRCISYLTIELAGPIPTDLRPALGNRIYGCDDCQLVCPWNRYARAASVADFAPRHSLDTASLADLFAWSAEQFDERMAGSAIRRIGHERWLRNIAVALGNVDAAGRQTALAALRTRRDDPSALVREHVLWAIDRLGTRPVDDRGQDKPYEARDNDPGRGLA